MKIPRHKNSFFMSQTCQTNLFGILRFLRKPFSRNFLNIFSTICCNKSSQNFFYLIWYSANNFEDILSLKVSVQRVNANKPDFILGFPEIVLININFIVLEESEVKHGN